MLGERRRVRIGVRTLIFDREAVAHRAATERVPAPPAGVAQNS
jgi:hypothetical protein